jgi:hypothetical protein
MIRRYCDACGTEITRNYVSERLKVKRSVRTEDGKWTTVEVEVHVGTAVSPNRYVALTWNNGDLCIGCVIDTVTIGDTRPQAAER